VKEGKGNPTLAQPTSPQPFGVRHRGHWGGGRSKGVEVSSAPDVPDTDGRVDLAEDAAERVCPKRASGGGRGGSGPRRRQGEPKGEGGSPNGLSHRLTSRIFSSPGGAGHLPASLRRGPGPRAVSNSSSLEGRDPPSQQRSSCCSAGATAAAVGGRGGET